MMVSGRQKQLLNFIQNYLVKNGIAPLNQEIKSFLKVSSGSTVNYHLTKLSKKGLINHTPYVDRGIEITAKGRNLLDKTDFGRAAIPILGIVSAGQPLVTFETKELIEVPRDMLTAKREYYALKVRGDSMVDGHICENDVLVVRYQVTASNGDTVIALIDGSAATVKTFYSEMGYIRLQPANRDYDPIFVHPPHTLEIQGIVVGVIRYKNSK